MLQSHFSSPFFFFNAPATTEIYTLSLHDALPIFDRGTESQRHRHELADRPLARVDPVQPRLDRKSTRLNSSHGYISYAVFCLKKKTKIQEHTSPKPLAYYKKNSCSTYM